MSKQAPTRPSRSKPGSPKKGPAAGAAKKPFPLVPVAAGVVALLAVVAIAVGALGGDDGATDESGVVEIQAVEIDGAALPPYAASGTDAAVGKAAPEVRGSGFDGEPVAITNDGRPKLVAFLAHWCPHCQAEVPVMVDWLDGRSPDGVDLIGVSTSVDKARPNYPPSSWLSREDWAFPTIADDEASAAAEAYGLTGFPYFVAVDAGGKVAARASGEQTIAQLEALVAKARG